MQADAIEPFAARSIAMDGVFTRREALASGYNGWAIRRELWSGGWTGLRAGVYVDAGELVGDERRRELAAARAALTAIDAAAVASHETVARLHGYPLPPSARDGVVLTREPDVGCHAVYEGLHVHAARLPATHCTVFDGVPTTTPSRTVVDLARRWRFPADGLTVADAALRCGEVDGGDLRRVVDECPRWPGIRRAASIVPLADACAESPLESHSRWMMRSRGVPEPDLQVEIFDQWGFVARSDFAWLSRWVIGECDGSLKYTDRAVLIAEKRRQDALERLGFVVVRWDWNDMFRNPAATCSRIMAALGRGGNPSLASGCRMRVHASPHCSRTADRIL